MVAVGGSSTESIARTVVDCCGYLWGDGVRRIDFVTNGRRKDGRQTHKRMNGCPRVSVLVSVKKMGRG